MHVIPTIKWNHIFFSFLFLAVVCVLQLSVVYLTWGLVAINGEIQSFTCDCIFSLKLFVTQERGRIADNWFLCTCLLKSSQEIHFALFLKVFLTSVSCFNVFMSTSRQCHLFSCKFRYPLFIVFEIREIATYLISSLTLRNINLT